MDPSAVAELKALLNGVDLPADKAALLEYAVRQRAEPQLLHGLRLLPEREFDSLGEVADELLHVQPVRLDDYTNPAAESGGG